MISLKRSLKTLATSAILLASSLSYAATFDVYLVRHFEKQAVKDNPALTQVGQKRAQQLAKTLKKIDLAVVYSTDYNRTKQTATPTAESKNLPVTLYDPRKLREFAKQVKAEGKTVLVVGHSNTTPAVIKLLGGQAKALSEKDYGELFRLTFSENEVATSSEQIVVD